MRLTFLPSLDPMTTSLTVRSGEASASWQAGLIGNATITANRAPLRTAPERVFFEVEVDGFDTPGPSGSGYDPRLHDLIYLWDFGDAGSTWTAPVNVLTQWRDANVGYGPFVSHVYRQPGTYTVSVLVIEPSTGVTAQDTYQVVVSDPDIVFAGDRTCYVSSVGDFSNAPAGARLFTDATDACREQAPDAANLHRVMFRRGESHQLSRDVYYGSERNVVHITAEPGSGPRPELIVTTNAQGSAGNVGFFIADGAETREFTFSGLAFRGGWDSTTESGVDDQRGIRVDATGRGHILVDDCSISGCSAAISEKTTTQEIQDQKSICVNDTFITNWREVGWMPSGASRYGIMGCRITCDPDALAGGGKVSGRNEHGPIRFNFREPNKTYVDGCDLFNRIGWAENVSPYRTQQPCIRGNQLQAAGSLLNVQRSSMEGGHYCISLSRIDDDRPETVQNMLVDKCVFVGSHMTQAAVKTNCSGVTVRNCVAMIPNVPRIGNLFNPRALVQLDAPMQSAIDAGALDAPIRVYNNTMVNHMSDANDTIGDAEMVVLRELVAAPDASASNNILHQPNIQIPDVDQGPLDTSILWAPREKGYVSQEVPVLEVQFATPIDTVQLPYPLEGSSALGAALGDLISYHDLFGNERPAYPSMGALEMG